MKKSISIILFIFIFVQVAIAEDIEQTMNEVVFNQVEIDSMVGDYLVEGWKSVEGGDYTQGEKSFKSALELKPEDVRVMEGLGQSYFYLEKYDQAKQTFLDVLRLQLENETAKSFLTRIFTIEGWDFIARDNLPKAEEEFLKALIYDGNNIKALEGLGRAYLYQAQYLEAEEMFNKVLVLEPENFAATLGLARRYNWDDKLEESIPYYNKALDLRLDDTTIQTELAQVYSWAGYHKESISQYEGILQDEPRNYKAYKSLAEVYTWDDNLGEAIEIYQNILKENPDDLEAQLGLAKIYSWMGYWNRSKKQYENLLKKYPENKEAQESLLAAKKELAPYHFFHSNYINEKDADAFRAHTFNYGYKQTHLLDEGNNYYVGTYFQDLTETGQERSHGTILEVGGQYNCYRWLSLLSSVNIRNYSADPQFFIGGDLSSVFKYFENNTLTIRYQRDIMDILDNVRSNRYSVESSMQFFDKFILSDYYSYANSNDDNKTTDWYHSFTYALSKKKPDCNLSIGYRYRDFYLPASGYYSPQGLKSMLFTIYTGQSLKSGYLYGMFRFSDNSDRVDSYYYLLGNDYALNDNVSIVTEMSYFDTEDKYSAITVTLSAKVRF